MFGTLGPPEILIILAVLVLLFGAKKLPELAKGMGQAIKEFKHGLSELNEDDSADKPAADSNEKQE